MIRVICFIKKGSKKSAIISMREPRSLCVSMCACVITMMDGAGGLYFVSSTKGLDQSKRRERGLSIVLHIRRGWMSSARGRGYEEEKETDDDDDDWSLSL